MNTTAYLQAHGWAGDGHALNNNARGLIRPLRAQPKKDALGIGKSKYSAQTNQWWAKAFDEVITSVNNTESQSAVTSPDSKRRTSASTERAHTRTSNPLYSSFTKGEGLRGTFQPASTEAVTTALSASENPQRGNMQDDAADKSDKSDKGSRCTSSRSAEQLASKSESRSPVESSTASMRNKTHRKRHNAGPGGTKVHKKQVPKLTVSGGS